MISSIFHWLIEEKKTCSRQAVSYLAVDFSEIGPRGKNTEFPLLPLRGFASRVQFVEKTKTLLGDHAQSINPPLVQTAFSK